MGLVGSNSQVLAVLETNCLFKSFVVWGIGGHKFVDNEANFFIT